MYIKLFKFAVATSLLFLVLTGCNSTKKENTMNDNYSTLDEINKNSNEPTSKPSAPAADASENKIVLLKTSMGDIKIELFNSTMPITAGNFEKLVQEGFYDNTIFHRVIPNFMAQGGDPTGTGRGGPGYKIQDEFTDNNSNDRGTISMANSGPNTGGSQFFINVVDNNYLDSKHPVFGKVISGMDIVDKITQVDTDSLDKPLEDILILQATIVEQ